VASLSPLCWRFTARSLGRTVAFGRRVPVVVVYPGGTLQRGMLENIFDEIDSSLASFTLTCFSLTQHWLQEVCLLPSNCRTEEYASLGISG